MRFRPCIDLHQGKVKQIVGETLTQDNQNVVENFVSELDSTYYAKMYQKDQLQGGHIIMLGAGNEVAATQALQAYPGGMQIGGGITADNATTYLQKGASHVIVTSFVFRNGELNMPNLQAIVAAVGKENLVIDLSCKERNGKWYVVTNQWTTFSDFEVNAGNIRELEQYCSEYLVHAVDVEGKQSGIQKTLASQLAQWVNIPTTYAGGARSIADLDNFKSLTNGSIDITIGSALDIFGGTLPYKQVVDYCKQLC